MIRPAQTLLLLTVAVSASLAMAQAPSHSLRPVPREGTVASATTAPAAASSTANAPSDSLRPVRRPAAGAGGASTAPKPAPATAATATAAAAAAAAAPKSKKNTKSGGLFAKRKLRRSSVCGDIDLQGENIGKVSGSGSCGVRDAIRLTSVSGITLSQPAVINCSTAKALKSWVDDGLVPAFKRKGKVVELKVAASYACRTRNSQRGAKLSEHAKGNAIDISGFTMKNGKVYTVQESWWRGTAKKPIRKAYKKACGPFGTTLGPAADKYHQDHFHFDVAKHRSGPYCK